MAPFMMYGSFGHPFLRLILMVIVWLVQLVVAFIIYRDAKEKKMLAPVWAVLAILPMIGFLADLVYLIIRELKPAPEQERPAGPQPAESS